MAKKPIGLSAATLKIKKTPMIERRSNTLSRAGKHKMGITRFIQSLLKLNETFKRSEKMTDAEIARQIRIEFPKSKKIQERFSEANPKLAYNVAKVRSEYNRGHLVAADGPPEQRFVSFTYNNNGDAVNPRYVIPRVLSEKQKQKIREKYKASRIAFEKSRESAENLS